MEPADGATTRKNRMMSLITHSRLMGPLPIKKLTMFLGAKFGLKPPTAGQMVHELESFGVFHRVGQFMEVNDAGFNSYLDLIGYGAPPVEVICSDGHGRGCGAVYSSVFSTCPSCNSVERRLKK